jgi:hypothetical protein
MSGMEKVALLLKSLPEPIVAKVLKQLDGRQAQRVQAELARVRDQSGLAEKLSGVLNEALEMLGKVTTAPPGQAIRGASSTVHAGTRETGSQVDIRVGGANDNAAANVSATEPASSGVAHTGCVPWLSFPPKSWHWLLIARTRGPSRCS